MLDGLFDTPVVLPVGVAGPTIGTPICPARRNFHDILRVNGQPGKHKGLAQSKRFHHIESKRRFTAMAGSMPSAPVQFPSEGGITEARQPAPR